MAAKLPGVYVTVEDRSYIEDQVASGRTGLIVIMSDRGPENRVVQMSSNARFFMKYGKPEINTTGQAHYIASQFLKRSNQLYVIRAALLDSPNPTHNCSLANVVIRYTPTEGGTEEVLSGNYIFTACGNYDGNQLGQWDEDNAFVEFGDEFISKYVFCNYAGYDGINVDEYISIDGSYESVKVIGKGQIIGHGTDPLNPTWGQGTSESNYIYYLELEKPYSGRSTQSTNGVLPITFKADVKTAIDALLAEQTTLSADPTTNAARLAEITVELNTLRRDLNNYYYHLYDSAFYDDKTLYKVASKFYFGPTRLEFTETNGDIYLPQCSFTKGSNVVFCKDEKTLESIMQEEWIMAEEDYQAGLASKSETSNILRQVVERVKELEPINEVDFIYKLVLDAPYEGVSTAVGEWDSIYVHTPIQLVSTKNVKTEREFSTNDIYNLFYFYAQGVGKYYNNIFLQGVRNYQLEKMYTDDDGNILYKYLFMDITIYGQNADGSKTILEGPWTVSLVNKVGDQVVRDLNTGRELYIVNTINERSEYIKCKEGVNASVLEGLTREKEELRLKVMALFSVSFVYRTKTRGQEGFFLRNGGDGIQYDVFGRLNVNHPEIAQLIRSAYSAELTSHDGSIQLLMQTLYPWYILDYVMSGGYDVDAQYAALELVDTRKDCLLLADTGRYSLNAREDLTARSMDVPWNSWNAALYTQYSTITDPYSGKQLTLSPVYHAIERHLTVDNTYFMSEPVAGIEKGAIQTRVTLAYKPSLADMQEMIEVELNPIITEPDGTYFLTQFSTYKRMSVMKRLHAVKIIHHLQKRLPSILKDLLQRKGTAYWINVAESRVNTFMDQFLNVNSPKHSFVSYNVDLQWDEDRSEIFIGLTVKPLRAIEAINVNIIVT